MIFSLYGRDDAGKFGYVTRAGDLDPLGVDALGFDPEAVDRIDLPPAAPPLSRLAMVDYPDPREVATRAARHLLAARRAAMAAPGDDVLALALEEAFAAFCVALRRRGIDARRALCDIVDDKRPGPAGRVTATILALLGDDVTADDIDPIRAELARLARGDVGRMLSAPNRYYLTGPAAARDWAAVLDSYDRDRAP
jgi:hypothetical protein